MKIVLVVLAALLITAASALLPVRPYLDFQVIYHADLGLLRGISLYDHAGQADMIAGLADVEPSRVFVVPFPYPPWYALSTLWLAGLPIDLAARIWFGLNVSMLLASVWLLTSGWPTSRRWPMFLAALFWLPTLGGLFVGQYGFPVLLGAALLTYALRLQKAMVTGIAAALLTFKPHLGALVVLMVLVYLWRRRDRFGRAAVLAILIAGAMLFTAGFLASPVWPLEYLHSLQGFRGVFQCHPCASASLALAGLKGGGLDQAFLFAALITVTLVGWVIWNWGRIVPSSNQLVVVAVLLTLLANPYLQNYDYLLLLVPFIELSRDASGREWIWLAFAYCLPWVSLAVLGPAGNASLIFSALLLFIQVVRRLRSSGEPSAVPA